MTRARKRAALSGVAVNHVVRHAFSYFHGINPLGALPRTAMLMPYAANTAKRANSANVNKLGRASGSATYNKNIVRPKPITPTKPINAANTRINRRTGFPNPL